jgi:superfamily II DNA or RNA helicase
LAMYNVNYRYSLALTATGNRLDGMDPLFRWPMAAVEANLDTDQMPATIIFRPLRHTQEFKDEMSDRESMTLDKDLALVPHRNTVIVNSLIAAYKNGRRIMVLSKSILQLRLLRAVFTEMVPDAKTAALTGEVTANGKVVPDLKRTAAKKRADERYLKDPDAVVFTTIGKGGVGYDDPTKDCLVLALPMEDPRQAIGRVQRRRPGKKMPIVLVLVDELWQIRRRVLSAWQKTIEPLGALCRVVNECPWYRYDLRGDNVRHDFTKEKARRKAAGKETGAGKKLAAGARHKD